MKTKSNYETINFTNDVEANRALLLNRDYHTLCVIQDCFGTVSPETLAKLAERGETFSVIPAWPTCKGSAWYRDEAKNNMALAD